MTTPRHYELDGVFIPADAEAEVEKTFPWATAQYQITANRVEFRYRPSSQLQELVGLGYSEAQGVKMLDAVYPEEKGAA